MMHYSSYLKLNCSSLCLIVDCFNVRVSGDVNKQHFQIALFALHCVKLDCAMFCGQEMLTAELAQLRADNGKTVMHCAAELGH